MQALSHGASFILSHGSMPTRTLLDDCSYCTRSYCTATLTDSESQTFLHSYWMDQFNCHCNVISRHAHLCAFRKLADTCYLCCSEVELRTIIVEERCMTATLILCQDVNLACEFFMAFYCTRFDQTLSSFDLCSLDTTKQSTDVITCTSLVEQLTEHLDT